MAHKLGKPFHAVITDNDLSRCEKPGTGIDGVANNGVELIAKMRAFEQKCKLVSVGIIMQSDGAKPARADVNDSIPGDTVNAKAESAGVTEFMQKFGQGSGPAHLSTNLKTCWQSMQNALTTAVTELSPEAMHILDKEIEETKRHLHPELLKQDIYETLGVKLPMSSKENPVTPPLVPDRESAEKPELSPTPATSRETSPESNQRPSLKRSASEQSLGEHESKKTREDDGNIKIKTPKPTDTTNTTSGKGVRKTRR